MERLRTIAAQLHTVWQMPVQYLTQKGAIRDYFRLAEVMLIFGGTHFASTKKWQCILWRIFELLAVFHTIVVVLCLMESVHNKDDIIATIWFFLILVYFISGFSKDYIVRGHIDCIESAKNFINGSEITSHDADHDWKIRKKLFRRIQTTCLVILANVCICELSVPFLMTQQDKSYRLPQVFLSLGPTLVSAIQVGYVATIFPLWTNKAFGPTILITAIMSAFETEYQIMTRGFGNLLDRIRSNVHGKASTRKHRDEVFWELLKYRIRFNVEQHIELLENLKQLQLVIKKLYFVVHYHAVVLIGVSIYMLLMEGTFVSRLIIVLSVATFSIECYWWCSIADSFQDVNKTLENDIFDLMALIPYQAKHHSDYVQLRTVLMIMKINVRNGAQFDCAGIFKLSKEAFVHIVNRSYFLLTFLMKVGPRSEAKVETRGI